MHSKNKWFLSAILTAGLIGFIAGAGFTDEGGADAEREEMMKQMMELAKPGPGHEAMAPMVGEWDVEATMWMEPGADPQKSKATSSTTWILGGRYALTKYSGSFGEGEEQMPFEGRGIMAFDNFKKQYQSVWIDSFSTSVMNMTGDVPAEGKPIETKGVWDGPMGKLEMRHEYIVESNDKHKMVGYMTMPGMGEMKHMELAFTRKKAAASNPRCCPPQKTKGPGY